MNRGRIRWSGARTNAVRLLFVFVVLTAAGCNGPSEADGADPQTVVLREWAVTKSLVEAPAGNLRFRVRNNGTTEHELVIVRTQFPADALPIDAARDVADVGASGPVAGRVGPIAGGDEQSVTFNMEAGRYVLICNLPGHYAQGMRTEFSVR